MDNFKKIRLLSYLMLIVTSIIWGFAFVAQSVGVKYIGSWEFTFLRFFIGAVILTPIAVFISRKNENSSLYTKKDTWRGGILCGIFVGIASVIQQDSLRFTTAGKAGFITSLYIIMVPFFAILIGKKIKKKILFSAFLAIVGMYFISVNEKFHISRGDLMLTSSAVFYAIQIINVSIFAKKANPIKLSCIQFYVAAVIGLIGAILFESFDVEALKLAATSILYVGIMSTAVGYTLQVVAQKYTDPTVAAIIMSMESVFSALGAYIILGEVLSLKELCGCLIVLTAVIMAQLPDKNVKNVSRET